MEESTRIKSTAYKKWKKRKTLKLSAFMKTIYANPFKHLTFIELRLYNLVIIKMFIKYSGKDSHNVCRNYRTFVKTYVTKCIWW